MRRTVMAERKLDAPLDHVQPVLRDTAGTQVVAMVVEAGGGGSMGQRVRLELLAPTTGPGRACWPVKWAPESKRVLLPSFDGLLLAQADDGQTRLVLTGWYEPPLGPVGLVFDAAVGGRVAQRSVERFLDRLAEQVAADVRRRADTAPWHPSAAAPDLNPHRVAGSAQ